MSGSTVNIAEAEGGARVDLSGRLVMTTLADAQRALAGLRGPGEVTFDLARLEAMDTGGAWLIVDLGRRLEGEGVKVRVENATALQQALIDTVTKNLPEEVAPPPEIRGFVPWLATVGEATVASFQSAIQMLGFFGLVVARVAGVLVRPWRLRFTSLVYHMQEVGLNAVPIVALMAFLIGVVLAFQGAAQLKQFGAGIFIVDLIAVSILRELGILLTSIIVAGRSGSAFTAAIGSMKMREEIDAMQTLGLDSTEVLIVPRVLALILMLPVLGLIANFTGLIGGALMAWIQLDISPAVFFGRMQNSIGVWQYLVGMIKAPFFAAIIGVVGCYKGMMVEGNAESLGRMTSQSVVLAIFAVITADALFSIFFSLVDV